MTSSAHPIDIGIFVVFLAVNLAVGLIYGRSVKTLKNYALGGKNFSTPTLVATIIATWFGGGFLYYSLANTYSSGLYFIIAALGIPINLLLSGRLAVRMQKFMHNVSLAEVMRDVYGPKVQIVTAISGILSMIGVTAMQFQAMSKVLSMLFAFDSTSATLVAAGIVITYSSFGGVRAVTFTDVLQFFTFGAIIPILALTVWGKLQDPTKVFTTLTQNPIFDITKVVGWDPRFRTTVSLFLYFAVPGLPPELFQRIAMASNTRQAKHALTYAAGVSLLIVLLVAWLGILLLTDKPGLVPDQVFPYMAHHHAYVGLKGLLCICVMALAMSTADSLLNASSILFANDVVRPLTRRVDRLLINARSSSAIMGILALLLALYSKDLLQLLMLSGSAYIPIFTVPVLLAVLGFRSSTRAVLIGMAAGLITVVLWSIFLENADSIFPGMLANLTGLLGAHYLLREPGGWQKLAPDNPLALERAARRQAWQRRLKAIRSFRLYPYLQQNLPQNEVFYFFFGLYTMAVTYAALYTIGDTDIKTSQALYKGIYYTVLPATTTFLTFPIWPPTIKSHRLMTFFWPLSIGGILFFAGTLLAIMSHFHDIQVMVMMINLIVAVMLLHWPLALFLAFAGTALAVFFFKHYTGITLPFSELGSLQFKTMYGLLLFTSFLIALFKSKQAYRQLEVRSERLVTSYQETTEELFASFRDRAKFVQAFRAAGAPALTQLASLSSELRADLQELNLPQAVIQKVKVLNEQLAPIAIQLDRLDHRAVGYLRLEVSTIPIDTLLTDVQDKLQAQNSAQYVRFNKLTAQATLQCDVTKIKVLLSRSVSFIRMITDVEAPILLSVEDTQLGYPLPSVKQGYIKKVAALRFSITTRQAPPQLSQCYAAQLNTTHSPAKTSQELPLVGNQRIIEAHYGYTDTTVYNKDFTLLYVIPVHLRAVRGKDTDAACMELGAELLRADDTYPGAQEQESIFLEAVAQRSQADISLVRKAIETIKVLHGPVRRKSGEPFYMHPLAVAHIVLDYNQDEATVLGALLHDTVEDTSMLLENIDVIFGKEVARIVDGVTYLESNQETFYKVQLSAHENIRKLLEVKDKRVLYVKLADRLHNMRTLQAKTYERQRSTAEETLLFFVPLAEKLGFIGAAEELKERSFEVLNRK